ncbi:acyl-CoA thioesterase [Cryptosporangium aurantiacum]|uniref:Acyl-CoA thioesterase II n=1 Tax=Cryptosporangium aurantiacum TaxID=134849 RepID=A0A1M7RA92_9ACTN|nr:acyl-CoA thioesterase domain-containing protein [Cryptosporangium aurantiacum]SHN43072.1 acyl-CoA thioesterase II [Cryptosporangium aurantiacum]
MVSGASGTSGASGASGASVDDVLDALRLRSLDAGVWQGDCVTTGGPAVFGGQLIGQALAVAAAAHPGKSVRSIHTTFARTGRPDAPVTLTVDTLHEGRTFAGLTVSVGQGQRRLARAQLLLDAPDDDLIRHASALPDVPKPDEAYPQPPMLDGWEYRFTEDVDLGDPDAVGPPELRVWSRFHTSRPGAAHPLLAWASVGFLIGTALRPHPGLGLAQAHHTLSTGPVTHALTFHDEFAADEWLLLTFRSTFAGGGRAYGTGEVHTAGGRLVASCSQDAMIRRTTGPGAL